MSPVFGRQGCLRRGEKAVSWMKTVVGSEAQRFGCLVAFFSHTHKSKRMASLFLLLSCRLVLSLFGLLLCLSIIQGTYVPW